MTKNYEKIFQKLKKFDFFETELRKKNLEPTEEKIPVTKRVAGTEFEIRLFPRLDHVIVHKLKKNSSW